MNSLFNAGVCTGAKVFTHLVVANAGEVERCVVRGLRDGLLGLDSVKHPQLHFVPSLGRHSLLLRNLFQPVFLDYIS